jgi:DNA-binding PadR family transcriptional regulator
MARRGETIELAVLGLLHEGPMHGYELRKRLNLMLGWGRVLSYGSLYPTLKKMLRAGLIEESAPTRTPVSRRPRITYEVTEAGTHEFERLMSEVGPTAWEDDNFDIRFAFFSSTDMEIRLRVLEGRRTRLQERLERVQGQLSMTQKEVDRYAAELQRHGVESVEREVRWLSDLINAERDGNHPGHDAARPQSSPSPQPPQDADTDENDQFDDQHVPPDTSAEVPATTARRPGPAAGES